MIGQTILHYRIEAKLGEGGMGAVYLATDTKLDRKVALKFLPPHSATDPESKTRFEREAKAAAALRHNNIVTVYELAEHEGRLLLAMEHVEGPTLAEYCQSEEPSIEQTLDLTIQIAQGLQEAHEAGVVHRDLKPSNILVDRHGQARILDFGLAKLKGATKVTKTGSTLGTASYMSPEQGQGQPVDHRTDIWSLGVILYEMIARRLPFEAEHEAAIAYAIAHEEPEPLARYKAGVSDELQRIVSKCLAKAPDERYQHADELVADLKHQRRGSESGVSGESATAPPERRKRRTGLFVSAAVVVFAVIALLVFKPWNIVLEPTEEAEAGYKMLAVLPFENLGAEEDEYFADGMTDEITSRLARVSALRVISRTSAMKYKNTDKTLPQIGEELGVDYILEGTILWDKSGDTDRVRITPQLIKVDDDFHVWADKIERPLTKLFAVQADIATHITEALNITLLAPERQVVEATPTENLDAYYAYARAMELRYRADYSEEHMRLVIALLDKAVALDSGFALAVAALSEEHSRLYDWGYDRSDERGRMAEMNARRALMLQPELPEAHLALGFYHSGLNNDLDSALVEFNLAQRYLPHDSRIMRAIGSIHWRKGDLVEASDYYERALELDPRDARAAASLGRVSGYLRRYNTALHYFDLVASLAPDDCTGILYRAGLLRNYLDNLDGSREALHGLPENCAGESSAQWSWLEEEVYERDFEAALRRLTATDWLTANPQMNPPFTLPFYTAQFYEHMGRHDEATVLWDSARVHLEQWIETHPEARPDDAFFHVSLGRAYAGLGLRDAALHQVQVARDLFSDIEKAPWEAELVDRIAGVYMHVGELDIAVDQLEYLLSIPSPLSVRKLRIDPRYDPLRDHPRFQALLEKGDKVF